MNVRDFQVEAEARSMSKHQKWDYLYSREWTHAGNNRWKHRPTGQVLRSAMRYARNSNGTSPRQDDIFRWVAIRTG